MKLSTRTRYGMRLMIDLAQHREEGYIALKDIAARQGISKKYLEQIVSLLMDRDLLKATRGFSGGYRLARDPEDITAADIIDATEGSTSALACINDATACERRDKCPSLSLWVGLEKIVCEYLQGITLATLAVQDPVAE